MNSSHTQQALNLQLAQENTFDTYYSGADSTLISVLRNVAMGILEEPQIFLWGMSNTGKTHVLQAMCHVAASSNKRAIYLPLKELIEQSPSSIDDLQAMQLVCVDDVHVIANQPLWEKALFNLINHLRAHDTTLVISSLYAPTDNIFALADLNSRTVWGPVYKLATITEERLDDALLFFSQVRGVELSTEVRKYLLTRFQRDVSSLVRMIEALDKASLEAQRKVTVPFLKKILS